MNEKTRKFIDAKKVADRYNTCPAVVYRWAREGKIPKNVQVRLGRKLMFCLESLIVWEKREEK